MNLGVGGYDMGQAYLRWRSTHAELQPGIVVFGLSGDNVVGNVTVIRAFYSPSTKLPFSKPRFVLEGDGLGIENVPSLAPREVLEVLRNPQGWELLPLETLYVEGERERRPWQHSRLLSLLFDRAGGVSPIGVKGENIVKIVTDGFIQVVVSGPTFRRVTVTIG